MLIIAPAPVITAQPTIEVTSVGRSFGIGSTTRSDAKAYSAQVAAQWNARLEDHLLDLGMEWVRLETGVSQPEALGLFEKRGYLERGPFGTYEENGWSVFFEKRLFHNPEDA